MENLKKRSKRTSTMKKTSVFAAKSFLAPNGSFATTKTNVEVPSGTISSAQELRSKRKSYRPIFSSVRAADVPMKKTRKASHPRKNSNTMNQNDGISPNIDGI